MCCQLLGRFFLSSPPPSTPPPLLLILSSSLPTSLPLPLFQRNRSLPDSCHDQMFPIVRVLKALRRVLKHRLFYYQLTFHRSFPVLNAGSLRFAQRNGRCAFRMGFFMLGISAFVMLL
uniref:Uncharacterized protein n=1 Tax=Parascaris univalens TaxID=6257 RepID=A0A915BWP7_PARUN